MSRESNNVVDDAGVVRNGYDYELQVWVEDYIVLDCGHPQRMRPGCCMAGELAGQDIRALAGVQDRS